MAIIDSFFLNKKFTINTFSIFALNALSFLSTLVIIPKLIYIFGVNDWGRITFFQIIINYFIWFIDWSFPQYACKQISIYENQIDNRGEIFTTTWTSQLILFFISSVILILFSLFFYDHRLIFIYSIFILFGSFLQSYWYLNGRERNYETAIFQLFNKLLFAYFVFNAISPKADISLYFLYFGLTNTIIGILFTLRILVSYEESIKIGNLSNSIKQIKKSFMLFNSSIIGNITNSSIPFILSSLYNLESLGIYNIADRIKNILIQILNPISNAIFPRMSKEYIKNKKGGNKKLIYLILIFLVLGLLILIAVNLNIEFVVNYFIKDKIKELNKIVRLLSISFLINVIYESLVNQYLVINNLYKEITKIKLIMLFASLILGLPFIYFMGILGAALTNLTYETLGLIYVLNIFIKTRNKNIMLLK